MKIKLALIITLLFSSVKTLTAQPPTHVPLMNDTWRLIAKKTYKKNASYKMVPAFPAGLKSLENKVVELCGYIIPLKAEMEYKNFMLAVVPYDQCPYCGQGDIPSMIEVVVVDALRHSDKPVKIRGKLVLNETGDNRSEIFLVDAMLVK
jgi:hypothetical protein